MRDNSGVLELKRRANQIRQDIITMLVPAKSGHPGGSLSAADILAALYFHEMKVKMEDPHWPERDHFVLSKGHAAPVLYAALAQKGFFPREELLGLRQTGRHLPSIIRKGFLIWECGQSHGYGRRLSRRRRRRENSYFTFNVF
ncbi:MAG: hypothetical protein WBJ83_08150 [Thermacetogeniaceae bacterium]